MSYSIWLALLVVAFVGIVVWAFGRRRRRRFEKDARIPFDEGKGPPPR
jgi:cytochrome c oxidase cbb3-type subunit 4